MSSPGKGTDVHKRSSADVQVKNLKKCFDDNFFSTNFDEFFRILVEPLKKILLSHIVYHLLGTSNLF